MIKLQIRNIDLSGFLIFFSTENCVCFLVDGAMRQVLSQMLSFIPFGKEQ